MAKKENAKGIRSLLLVIIALAIAALSFFIGFVAGKNSYPEDIDTINYILSMYKKYYYEESDDIVQIIEDALLDKYSTYYTAEEYDVIKKTAKGEREGLGITVNTPTLQIVTVAGNSPAKKAGLKEGTVLLGIKASSESDFVTVNVYTDFSDKLSSIPANTDLDIKVSENGHEQVYTLQKKEYTQSYVSYFDSEGEYVFTDESGSFQLVRFGDNDLYPMPDENKSALIRYTGFSGNGVGLDGSVGQFAEVMKKFKTDGKTRLIIDLRGNGGGYVSIMCEIAAHLIDGQAGKSLPVMISRDKNGNETVYKSGSVRYGEYSFESIIFLADEGTASASEALMGAVLDYDAKGIVKVIVSLSDVDGVTVAKTYGKGIMQTTYTRGTTGAAIKLTTAKIYWPSSGTCIHDVGLTPDLSDKIVAEKSKGSAFYDSLNR